MAATVLITDHVFADLEPERAVLDPLDCELRLAEATDEQSLIEAARGCEAILACYARVTAAVVEAAAASGCRVIARYGIGYDNIDLEAATKHRIPVTNVPDYCFDEVADHTMALLLTLARGVALAGLDTRDGEWRVPHGEVHRLQGRRLAVIGLGGIGRRVVDRALAFGIKVVGYDPYLADWDAINVRRAASLEEAISEADFVSLHVPMSEENRHMIDAATIATMSRAPIVVNTSRGPLVDFEAAWDAVREGRIGGLGLDVTDPEPPPADHPMRKHPNVVLTPHMAFYSVEAEQELQRRAASEVARALRGEPVECLVNTEVLDASQGGG